MNQTGAPRFGTRGDGAADPGATALRIERMRCLNLRARHVVCTRCADACAAEALQPTAEEVRLDAGRCTACGACLPVCPSGAVALRGFDPRRFLQAVAGAAEIHIHCRRSDHPDGGRIVPCLGILDARLLAAAAAEGTETVVLHGTARCSRCDRGDARGAVTRMRAELKSWFAEAPVRLREEGPARTGRGARSDDERARLSRRDFLRFAGPHADPGGAKRIADGARERDGERDETTARWPVVASDGGGRPSAYHELLAERAGALPWRERRLPWRARLFGDACRACLACVRACPAGALVAEETESAISLRFDLRRCTDCGLCQRLCPEGAISCATVAGPQELRAPPHRVIHRRLRRCARCARGFVPGPGAGELCTRCRNEREVESDWRAMLIESSTAAVPRHETPDS